MEQKYVGLGVQLYSWSRAQQAIGLREMCVE